MTLLHTPTTYAAAILFPIMICPATSHFLLIHAYMYISTSTNQVSLHIVSLGLTLYTAYMFLFFSWLLTCTLLILTEYWEGLAS